MNAPADRFRLLDDRALTQEIERLRRHVEALRDARGVTGALIRASYEDEFARAIDEAERRTC